MIVAGFGFRVGASVTSLEDAMRQANCGRQIGCLATTMDKAEATVFRRFASGLGLRVRGIDSATLAAQETQTQSQASNDARGTGSVAEAAALAAAGPGARLLAPRVISADGMATCALAEGDGA
jgi:cobalt-precorrin 5A hydrolase